MAISLEYTLFSDKPMYTSLFTTPIPPLRGRADFAAGLVSGTRGVKVLLGGLLSGRRGGTCGASRASWKVGKAGGQWV